MKYKSSRLLKIIDRFKGKEILVVGDLMFDGYIIGDVNRISPEAPVPVVKHNHSEYRIGGAANVANNISSLEGKAYLCGIVGVLKDNKDFLVHKTGELLIDKARERNINCDGVFKDKNRRTTSKIRLVANYKDQQIVRYDVENTEDISKNLEKKIINYVESIIPKTDVVIFSDYGKGLLTKRVVESIMELAEDKITIVDTKPEREHYFKGCSWFTPNREEAERITKVSYKDINDRDNLTELGKRLSEILSPQKGIIVTCGGDGMFLYDLNNSFKHIPTVKKEVSDVSGAGDTVVAAFGLSLAAGAKPMDAVVLANHAAGIVVGKAGTATASIDELRASLNNK